MEYKQHQQLRIRLQNDDADQIFMQTYHGKNLQNCHLIEKIMMFKTPRCPEIQVAAMAVV